MKVYPQNFLVFWSYQDQQGPVLVTSPHCAKKNNTGTLLKLLAGTCWHHLVEGAKRETILSEKGLKQLDKKHERLQYLIFSVSGAIQWTCSCPLNSSLQIIRRAGVSSCPWRPWWSDLSDHLLGENRTTKPTRSGCRESEIMLKVKACYCANWSEKCSRAILLFSLAPAFKFYCSRKSARIWFERHLVIELSISSRCLWL